MYYAPKHAVAPPRPSLHNRVAGAAVVGSAALVTGVGLSAPAQAADTVWDSVAACESGGNWSINTGNGFTGGLQFLGSTWVGFGGTRFAPRANLATKAQQIAIAQRVLAAQGPRAWPVCSKRAGLTHANGGATARPVAPTVSRSKTRTAIRPAVAPAGKLAVDGLIGPITTRAAQRWVGVKMDGVFGPRTARALQRKVGARVDGIIGPQTIRALQVKIGANRDGARRLTSHTPSTTAAALQRYLNSH